LGFGVVFGLAEGVGRIVVRADEIGRQIVACAERDEILDPGIGGGCRSADLQLPVHGFDGSSGMRIELEIVLLPAAAERFHVGFVPDFEEPLAHFLQAVAVDPMGCKFGDQRRPLVIILRRADVGAVVENDLAAGRQHGRHEAQFDERRLVDREQEIEDMVGIEERVERLVVLVDE
jgi:hypothetical protein